MPDSVREVSPALEVAQHSAALVPLCGDCLEDNGLCAQHARDVLPQLARAAWLRLIGLTHTEQTALQEDRSAAIAAPTTVSDASARHAERKRAARHASKLRRATKRFLTAIAA